jgi:hypothetical protein
LPTLKEQQEALVISQHRLAVWEVLYQYLDSTYVPREGCQAEKAIRVPDCIRQIVNEDTIEEILGQISGGPINDLKKRINDIENMEVVLIPKQDDSIPQENNN